MSRSNAPSQKGVPTFLSCSIDRADQPLVDALARKVLHPLGFRCYTVGRNYSSPAQADDAMRLLLTQCHCLVGVATARLDAVDSTRPERSLCLATPYLLQETSMAFQVDMPWLIIKTPDVDLQGVTQRNLYLEVSRELSAEGRPRFLARQELVLSTLTELRARAQQHSRADRLKGVAKLIGWGASLYAGANAVSSVLAWLQRPDCFGTFYWKDTECRDCAFKADCKAEKALRQHS